MAHDPGVEPNFWRIFCALEISEELREMLRVHIARLREIEIPSSWSHPENLHLTLKFLGNVSRDTLERVSSAAARASADIFPFEITVGTTGVFPKPRQARVLWVGVKDPTGNLALLQQRLESECAKEGFVREEREFRPHLTIARPRASRDVRKLANLHIEMGFKEISLPLKELLVFRSELGRGGSKYTVVSRHALKDNSLLLGPQASRLQ